MREMLCIIILFGMEIIHITIVLCRWNYSSFGGGMEYPNVTVIGESETARALETVIMHEVGHNWFYGILGSNERDHAFGWMKE